MSLLQVGLIGIFIYIIWFIVSISITMIKIDDFTAVLYRTTLVSSVLLISKVMIVELVVSLGIIIFSAVGVI